MRLFAADDVLIRVVDVVVGDVSRRGLVAHQQRKTLEVELTQKVLQLGRRHAFCFSLQVMHTRVQGIAFSRASAMGSPQSRHTPNVPFSMRASASSMAC